MRQCNKGKTVLGEKPFASYESVFELARGLRESQTSINNQDLGLLPKKEAEKICIDNILSSLLCVFGFFSVICRPIHLFYASCGFQKCQKCLIKIFIQGTDLRVKMFCFALDMSPFRNKYYFTE